MSLLLLAVHARWARIAVVSSVCITLAFANRSPLLYLIVPLVVLLHISNPTKWRSSRIALCALAVLAIVASMGTYRALSQDDFRNYTEYRAAIAANDLFMVATIGVTHYADIVPQNAALSKDLLDQHLIEQKWGLSYLALIYTALPGEQLSLDREIKQTTGKTFVGGGTPPTLAGEGYINFGYVGVVLSGVMLSVMIVWASRFIVGSHTVLASRVGAVVYGYAVAWVAGAQVAGFTGASTFPLCGAALLVVMQRFALSTGGRVTISVVARAGQPQANRYDRPTKMLEELVKIGQVADNYRTIYHGRRKKSSRELRRAPMFRPGNPLRGLEPKTAGVTPVMLGRSKSEYGWLHLYDDWSLAPDINLYHRFLARRSYSLIKAGEIRAKLVTVNSRYVAEKIMPAASVVVPNGVDPVFADHPREGDDRRRLVVFGHFFRGRTDFELLSSIALAGFDEVIIGSPGKDAYLARTLSVLKSVLGTD